MISTRHDGDVAIVTFSRASSRNAFRVEDWQALQATLNGIANTRARVVLVESAVEGAFCAGSDLKSMEAFIGQPEHVAEFRIQMRSAIDTLAAMSMPTIADIQGDCFGAGVAVALACDLRVVGEIARFGVTPAKLGISYPVEDIARLVRAVGPGQASRMLMVADTVSAIDAVAIGLAQISGDASIASKTAAAIARNAPESVSVMKCLIRSVVENEAVQGDQLFDALFLSAAFGEGLKAFREKRHPVFPDISQ